MATYRADRAPTTGGWRVVSDTGEGVCLCNTQGHAEMVALALNQGDEMAALREIVAAVTQAHSLDDDSECIYPACHPTWDDSSEFFADQIFTNWGFWRHSANCPVTRARALLTPGPHTSPD